VLLIIILALIPGFRGSPQRYKGHRDTQSIFSFGAASAKTKKISFLCALCASVVNYFRLLRRTHEPGGKNRAHLKNPG
jgi:hypothetical protein